MTEKKLSGSESIVNEFVATKNSLSELKKKMDDEIMSKCGIDAFGNSFERAQIENKYKDHIFQKEKKLKEYLRKLYSSSSEDNFYYFDSPFAAYEHHYEQRFLAFIEKHIDADESDFIKQELQDINNPKYMRVLTHNEDTVNYHNFIESEKKLNFSKNKKISFLTEKLRKEGWKIKMTGDVFLEHYDRTIPGEMYFEELPESEKSPNNTQKLKWIGKPAHLGYILGVLADSGFIDAPKRESGDINYTKFSKQVLNIFDIKTTENTLSKYLNTTTEKALETQRNFNKANFNIPNKKEVS